MPYDHTFEDRAGRTIEFEVNPESITAYFNGRKIGEFTLNVVEFPMEQTDVHADVIDIDEEFHRAGIGLEMVRLASEANGCKLIPPSTYYPNKEQRNTMTQGGYALMRAGQRLGYVRGFPDIEYNEPDAE